MRNKRAVVSMAIQLKNDAVRELTEPQIQHYAERIGADYVCIDQNLYPDNPEKLMLNKLQLGDLLQHYERLIYLDLDVLISPLCRDLFAEVPEDSLGVWNQPENENVAGYRRDVQQHFGEIPGWDTGYFNAGVMVLSRRHVTLFDRPADLTPLRLLPEYISDQHFMNWNSRQLGYSLHLLPDVCNWNPEQRWLNPWAEVLHFWRNGFEWPAVSSEEDISRARVRQIAHTLQLWAYCSPDDPESARKYYAASQHWSLPFLPPKDFPKLDEWMLERFRGEKQALEDKIADLAAIKADLQIKRRESYAKLVETKEKLTRAREQISRLKLAKQPAKPTRKRSIIPRCIAWWQEKMRTRVDG